MISKKAFQILYVYFIIFRASRTGSGLKSLQSITAGLEGVLGICYGWNQLWDNTFVGIFIYLEIKFISIFNVGFMLGGNVYVIFTKVAFIK